MRFVGFTLALAVALVELPLAAARSGDLDATLGEGGKVVSDVGSFAHSLAIQRDGKIVAATSGDGHRPVRFLASGRLDRSFGGGGSTPTVGPPSPWPRAAGSSSRAASPCHAT